MLKIVFIVSWIIGTLFARYIPVKSMDVVTRREMRYEVTDISYDTQNLKITGWGFMYMKQHFINASTHDIFIQFENEFENYRFKAVLSPVDQTQLLRYGNAPRCKDSDFNQHPTQCYYDYANVGFTVSVPLSSFVLNRNYTAYLIVHAKQMNLFQKIPLFYPINQPIKTKIQDIEYSSISYLKDTEIVIIAAHVYARSGPSTTHPIYTYGTNCSTAYLNRTYFRENTTYKSVLERYFDGTNTYYRVSADPSVCYLSRRRIVEGNMLKPVWIVSSFVQYGGTPLMITSQLINTAPWLEITNPIIYKNDLFDYKSYIKAFDKEEGEISEKIQVLSNTFENKAGVYPITFEVSDKYGYKASGIMSVTVLEPINTPPTITAQNRTIVRYKEFDPLENVYAFDIEDGNITDQISVTGGVDKTTIGEYVICYHVTDSHGATSNKCIVVSVIKDPFSNARFISYHAKNTAKFPWPYLVHVLKRELLNVEPYINKIIKN
jgi:hypothetical protein